MKSLRLVAASGTVTINMPAAIATYALRQEVLLACEMPAVPRPSRASTPLSAKLPQPTAQRADFAFGDLFAELDPCAFIEREYDGADDDNDDAPVSVALISQAT